jgi:hypothetical protein
MEGIVAMLLAVSSRAHGAPIRSGAGEGLISVQTRRFTHLGPCDGLLLVNCIERLIEDTQFFGALYGLLYIP